MECGNIEIEKELENLIADNSDLKKKINEIVVVDSKILTEGNSRIQRKKAADYFFVWV